MHVRSPRSLQSPLRRITLVALLPALAASLAMACPPGPYPPKLPDGKTVVTDSSPEMLQVPDFAKSKLTAPFTIAKTPPTIDFMYYPGQNHVPPTGNPWSDWSDGTTAPDGGTLYIIMNGCLPISPNTYQGKSGPHGDASGRNWYAVSLFAIHIPEAERQP